MLKFAKGCKVLAVTCSSSRSRRVRDAVHCSWVPGTGSTRQPRVRRQLSIARSCRPQALQHHMLVRAPQHHIRKLTSLDRHGSVEVHHGVVIGHPAASRAVIRWDAAAAIDGWRPVAPIKVHRRVDAQGRDVVQELLCFMIRQVVSVIMPPAYGFACMLPGYPC
jgi:hypothetical protein